MTHAVSPLPTLNDGFPDADLSAWEALAAKALKGAPLSKLDKALPGGVVVKPLYRAQDRAAANVPPLALSARDPFMPWDIRQVVATGDATRANQDALDDLIGGANSIEFCLDSTGACGVVVRSVKDFECLLTGIDVSLATVAISGPSAGLEAAEALANGVPVGVRSTARLAFNLDPYAAIMTGSTPMSRGEVATFVAAHKATFPAARLLAADARAVHEGGGNGVDELAVMIAAGLEALRTGEAAGLTPSQTNDTLTFKLAVGADTIVETARLRAARLLWANVLAACGAEGVMYLHAITSGRMMTARDAWTNMIRTTCAAFSGAVGGADVITVAPFTAAQGQPTDAELARRIARNSQLILQAESHLGAVADPGAGSFAIEALTRDFAEAAWARVQEIEAAGGLLAALNEGRVQDWVAQARAGLIADVARRKVAVVGVSEFANLAESSPPVEGATEHPSLAASAIPPIRHAAPFEAMRSQADGKPNAKVFLATLGPLSKFSARAGFARNAFEAGGLAALGADQAHTNEAQLITAFTASSAQIACLCGDDASYAQSGEAVVSALKAAGAQAVWLAGKADIPGVDRTLFAGGDILAELNHAHSILGLTS